MAAPLSAQFSAVPVWSDEFDYSGSPDPARWAFETGGGGWGNNELQHYTSRTQNARVENGMLVINARRENYGGNAYTSARMHSIGAGSITYGRIEVRARFTGAAGTWPAIWMLATDWGIYGNWPDCGEIDIMEHVSTHGESVQASIHTRDYNFQIGTAKVGFQYGVDYWNWHDYILEWYPNRLDVTIDNSRFFSFRDEGQGYGKWPFDTPFHLMLNVAVGGWGGTPTFSSETLEIDHVRISAYTGQSQFSVHPEAWYRLVNRNSGKVLDIDGPSTADGSNLHQWDWFDLTSQHWRFEPAGDGAYRMISRYSGKACDVAGASWANGANIQQTALNGNHAQDWWLQPVGAGHCKIVSRETGRVLDVTEASPDNGANVQQWDYAGGANQEWLIEQVEAPPAPPAPTGLQAVAGGEQVALFWDAGGIYHTFNVKRSSFSGGPYEVIATHLTEPRFSDTGLAGGKSCYYVVSAMNGTTESSADSSEAAAIVWNVALARNAGGPVAAPFAGDAYFSGGTAASTAAAIDRSGLTNSAPESVYQSERYGNMTYTLPGLTAGASYRVRLHFAETYWTAAGQRRFNVAINGAGVLSNFDVFASAGKKDRAIIREFDATATAGGQIVILLSGLVDNANVSGIEVMQAPLLIPPRLSGILFDFNFEMYWPASATAFNLYSTTNLLPPAVWSPVTNAPIIQGDYWKVSMPVVGTPQFFMLEAPAP